MEFLKPLVGKNVLIYLFGGGLLDGKLASVGADHLILQDQASKRGQTEKIPIDRFISRNAVMYVEEDRGQRAD
jgi:hypothetical protein